jgi:hypothetical protein
MRRVLAAASSRTHRPLRVPVPPVVAATSSQPPHSSYSSSLTVQHKCFLSTDSSSALATVSSSALANASKDGVVGHPIDFDVNSKIEGNESQIVTVTLEPGQVLRAESGAMMYMTNGVEMNTTTG